MENENNISLAGTKILLTLFAQKYVWGYKHFESILPQSQSLQKTLNYKEPLSQGIKTESCVINLFSLYCEKIVTLSNSKSKITPPPLTVNFLGK